MVYLEGTDTIGHLLAQYEPPPTLYDVDAATAAVYAPGAHRYSTSSIAGSAATWRRCPLDEYAVVLVSDHGFKWGRERPRGLSGTAVRRRRCGTPTTRSS